MGQELCKCQVIVQQKSCKIWKILATTINVLFMACKYSSEYRLLLGKNKHRANLPKYSLITKFQFVCSCLWENTRLQAAQLKKPRRIYNSLSYFPTDKEIKAKNLGKWRGKTRVWMTHPKTLHLLDYKQFCCAWISLLNLFVFKLPSSMAELNKLHMSELQVKSSVMS